VLHLDLSGAGPLNQQLARALKAAVLDGRLAPGTRVPASRELARALRVSRNTVVDAYEQLGAEGFLAGRVGAGTFVALRAAPRPPRPAAAPRAPRLSGWGRRVRDGERAQAALPRGGQWRFNLEYGVPLVLPALHSAWRRALSTAVDRSGLGYMPPHGLPVLREAIAAYLGRRRGIVADPEDVVVLAGTQQGVELASRLLADPGDRVLLEDPCYPGTRRVLAALGARALALPVDADGLDTARLPRAGARLAVVTPSHQFPSGAVLSLPRRLALLAWARRHDAWIVEDDYDGEFRHDGRPLAALKALDADGRVVYVGSFSKVVFPALRLGFALVPPSLRETFRAARFLVDRGSPAVVQQALADLLASGRLERLLRRSGQVLRQRRAALLAGLVRHCGAALEVEGAAAGMHVTAWLRDVAPGDLPALVAAARRVDLGIYPITPYYASPPRRAGLLLGYAALAPRDLGEAARRLGGLLGAPESSRTAGGALRHNARSEGVGR
jgi:GntR family transcriptional regulator/MocR family aminotransferase